MANLNTFIQVGANTGTFVGSVNTTGNIQGGNLRTAGTITATGNITGGNLDTAGNVIFTANTSNIVFNNTAYISGNANSIGRDGSLVLQPYTGVGSTFPGVVIGGAGRLIAPNGSVHQVFNASDVSFQVPAKVIVSTAATSTSTGALIVSGGAGLGGNLYVAGNTTTGNNAVVAGVTNTLLANSTASFSANVNSYTQITYQNKNNGADATADIILTADNGNDTVNYSDFGIINSGYDNGTPTNSLGNIVYAGDTYLYAQGNVSNTSQSGGNLAIGTTVPNKTVNIFAGGNTNSNLVANISNTGIAITGRVSATGNISTSGAFVGNGAGLTNVAVSLIGNVQGTQSNVTLQAGSYSWTFDTTGKATFPLSLVTTPVPFANLTAVAGARAFVNNSNLAAAGNYGAQISGGGANTVPVWSNGTNWYIG